MRRSLTTCTWRTRLCLPFKYRLSKKTICQGKQKWTTNSLVCQGREKHTLLHFSNAICCNAQSVSVVVALSFDVSQGCFIVPLGGCVRPLGTLRVLATVRDTVSAEFRNRKFYCAVKAATVFRALWGNRLKNVRWQWRVNTGPLVLRASKQPLAEKTDNPRWLDKDDKTFLNLRIS